MKILVEHLDNSGMPCDYNRLLETDNFDITEALKAIDKLFIEKPWLKDLRYRIMNDKDEYYNLTTQLWETK